MTAKPKPTRKIPAIILDANAFFVPLTLNIDIFEGIKKILNRNFELVLLSSTLEELERISTHGSPKKRKQAENALRLTQKCRVLKTSHKEKIPVDDIIVRVASNQKYAVFTNDRQLRKRLRDINVPVIYVRQKSRLEIDGRL
jgi:rRNA-processing protein FCF1